MAAIIRTLQVGSRLVWRVALYRILLTNVIRSRRKWKRLRRRSLPRKTRCLDRKDNLTRCPNVWTRMRPRPLSRAPLRDSQISCSFWWAWSRPISSHSRTRSLFLSSKTTPLEAKMASKMFWTNCKSRTRSRISKTSSLHLWKTYQNAPVKFRKQTWTSLSSQEASQHFSCSRRHPNLKSTKFKCKTGQLSKITSLISTRLSPHQPPIVAVKELTLAWRSAKTLSSIRVIIKTKLRLRT